jgi:hypothetical protein
VECVLKCSQVRGLRTLEQLPSVLFEFIMMLFKWLEPPWDSMTPGSKCCVAQ